MCCRDWTGDLFGWQSLSLVLLTLSPCVYRPCWYWTALSFYPPRRRRLSFRQLFKSLDFFFSLICSLLPFPFSFRVYLSCIIFAASFSLNLGAASPLSCLFCASGTGCSTLTATSPMFSVGIKNPCRPHLPSEWISYPGFKEISLLSVPWRLSLNTMRLFVLTLISPIRERDRGR